MSDQDDRITGVYQLEEVAFHLSRSCISQNVFIRFGNDINFFKVSP